MLVVARAVPYMVPAVHDFAKGAVVFFPTIDDDEEEDNRERGGSKEEERDYEKNKNIFMSATTYAKLTLFIHHPSSSFFTLSAR